MYFGSATRIYSFGYPVATDTFSLLPILLGDLLALEPVGRCIQYKWHLEQGKLGIPKVSEWKAEEDH